MAEIDTLNALKQGDIDCFDAYKRLYPTSGPKRARFMKISIKPRHVNIARKGLLRGICLLPYPLRIARFILKRNPSITESVDTDTLLNLINYAHGVQIHIESDDARISIKFF